MFATRLFHILMLAVAVLCVVQGSWWDENRLPNRGARAMIRRQNNDPPSTPTGAPSSTGKPEPTESSAPPPAESSSAPPPADPTSAPPAESSTTKGDPTTANDPTKTSSSEEVESTTADPESSKTQDAPETTSTSQSDEQDQDTSKTKSQVVSTSTNIVTKTNDDGSKETVTEVTKHTSEPGLGEDEQGGSSGMTPKTRNTIIGVVVGVGGAIVLGALGLVAWRIWGKKKLAEENDGLMAYDNSTYGGASGEHKSEISSHSPSASTSQRSPFQSTLENYHQPAHVNASSNF